MFYFLLFCLILGDENSALFLINHGADVNMTDARDNSPLHIVLDNGNTNMLSIAAKLIEQGAHIDTQNTDLM